MINIFWAFDTEDLDASSEIDLMSKEVSGKWYLSDNIPSNAEQCDLMVYVFGKSGDSTGKLRKEINYLNSAGKVIPLIVCTGRAGGNGRLSEEEFSLVKRLDKYITADMPETLKTAFRNVT